MDKGMKMKASIVAAVLAASAGASAWAVQEIRNSSLVPQWRVEDPAATTTEAPPVEARPIATERVVTQTEVPAEQRLTPGERIAQPDVVAVPTADIPREPPITITQPRLTPDARIQGDVVELLARANASGRVQVTTLDRVVTLSGYTTTAGQAWRLGRDAARVQGVRQVVNEIRPRVGAITG